MKTFAIGSIELENAIYNASKIPIYTLCAFFNSLSTTRAQDTLSYSGTRDLLISMVADSIVNEIEIEARIVAQNGKQLGYEDKKEFISTSILDAVESMMDALEGALTNNPSTNY